MAEAPLTPGLLASLTVIGSAAMINRVDRLVDRGFIHRETNPENRRQLLTNPARRHMPEWMRWWSTTLRISRRCSGVCQNATGTGANLLRKFLQSNNDGELGNKQVWDTLLQRIPHRPFTKQPIGITPTPQANSPPQYP